MRFLVIASCFYMTALAKLIPFYGNSKPRSIFHSDAEFNPRLQFRARPPTCPLEQMDEPGCKVVPGFPVKSQITGVGAYNYLDGKPNGPSLWSRLDCTSAEFSEFRNCGYCTNVCDGNSQTPIDLITSQISFSSTENAPIVRLSRSARLSYVIKPLNFELKCSENSCGTTFFENVNYELLNVHAHSRSEHQVNGRDFPIELHFVHNAGDQFLVLGLFVKIGFFNINFQKFLNIAKRQCEGNINLRFLIKTAFESKNVVHYDGSLTTPPCSEGLNWIVSLKPLSISASQIEQYRKLLAFTDNNRPLQPLNGRELIAYR